MKWEQKAHTEHKILFLGLLSIPLTGIVTILFLFN